MLVKESIYEFERGKDPKEILGIGDTLFSEIISEEIRKLMLEFDGNHFEQDFDIKKGSSFSSFYKDHVCFYIAYEKSERRIGFSAGYFGYNLPRLHVKTLAMYINKSKKCKSLKGAVLILKRFIKEYESKN